MVSVKYLRSIQYHTERNAVRSKSKKERRVVNDLFFGKLSAAHQTDAGAGR
jgi:hypothetical protein